MATSIAVLLPYTTPSVDIEGTFMLVVLSAVAALGAFAIVVPSVETTWPLVVVPSIGFVAALTLLGTTAVFFDGTGGNASTFTDNVQLELARGHSLDDAVERAIEPLNDGERGTWSVEVDGNDATIETDDAPRPRMFRPELSDGQLCRTVLFASDGSVISQFDCPAS